MTIAQTAPKVEVCFFAGLKDKGKGTLWSSWGDGCLAKSGKYYTSVGDHLGNDANSYVYEYDPATMQPIISTSAEMNAPRVRSSPPLRSPPARARQKVDENSENPAQHHCES